MRDLYEYLRVDLGMNSPEVVFSKMQNYKTNEIEELISHLFQSIKINFPDKKESIYNFRANNSLAGAGIPCGHLSCRLERLEELMRFSSLYADSVYITSPFDKYMQQLENAQEIDRFSLGTDIVILLELESLVTAKIVKFQSEYICLCSECSKGYSEDIHVFENRIGESYNTMLEECASVIRCELLIKDYPEIHISNAEEYGYYHDTILSFKHYIPDNIIGILKETSLKSIALGKQDVIKIGIPHFMLNNVYDDVLMNYVYSKDSNISYLTDRKIDFGLLNKLNMNKENNLDLLDHTLSIIPNIGIDKIVDLRNKDGESFKVYRDTLNQELKQLKNPSHNEIRDFQREIIQPQLNKMNLTLKNHKRYLIRETKRDIVLWGGILSIGMISGVLENNFNNLFNVIGGMGTLHSFYDKVDKYRQVFPIENEQYYFLWKLNNG